MTILDEAKPTGDDSAGLGIIGSRQLISVQTFDIARLTSHPVVLVPSSFIAVTGRGPRDSNESGKTSFNAAVALLLGDPEWRVSGGGVATVAELLFEPDTAGVAATRYPAAQVGFVVGVFAAPDDVEATAHTVWMKLSSQPKYVQVRHARGVHLVSAGTDAEQHRLASQLWGSLPLSSELGAQSYVDTLYGRSPRCLAYVAARGKQRSGPSLLKMDTGAFRPQDIGAALVRLTGRSEALETEQAQRRTLAGEMEQFDGRVRDHSQKLAAEEELLKGVHVRKQVRALLAEGNELWQRHLARGLLDALARRGAREQAVKETSDAVEELTEAVHLKQEAERKLAQDEDVRGRASEAADLLEAAEDRLREARREETLREAQAGDLGRELNSLEAQGAKRSRLDVETATRDLDDRRDEFGEALAGQRRAEGELAELETQLGDAIEGRAGEAGRCIKLLAEAGVDAFGVLDSVETSADHRNVWEGRLYPWRDAVCVPSESRDLALDVLAQRPGALLIVGDDKGRPLPEGILAAPRIAVPFLTTLQSRATGVTDRTAVHDDALSAYVVSGFPQPISGRAHLIAALTARRDVARDLLERLTRTAILAKELQNQAESDLAAALAAVKYLTVAEELRDVETVQLPKIRADIERLARAKSAALEAHTAAQGELRWLENARAGARHERELVEKDLTAARLKLESERRSLNAIDVNYWAVEFAGGDEDAYWILNWQRASLEYDDHQNVARVSSTALDPEKPIERRTQDTLAIKANETLTEIITKLVIDRGTGDGAPTSTIADAVSQRDRQTDTDGSPLARDTIRFTALAGALQDWLVQVGERDEIAEEQITLARQQRTSELTFTEMRLNSLNDSLTNLQDSLEQRIEGNLSAISAALDSLNRAEGYGACLNWEVVRPETLEDTWIWKVTPMWRRSPGGRMLPYNNATNSAQEKLFSVHLVLAALLASPSPRGRVLILDELGDSLGEEHRRDVLTAVSQVAKQHGITVLGTCQDAVMPDAASYCAEILYFCYPSKADALNLPTRMFGFDSNRERVELTADLLQDGRPWP